MGHAKRSVPYKKEKERTLATFFYKLKKKIKFHNENSLRNLPFTRFGTLEYRNLQKIDKER